MGYRTGIIELDKGISIEYKGELNKAEPDTGIVADWFEIDDIFLVEGDLYDYSELISSYKGYWLEVIEGKILEQIENER